MNSNIDILCDKELIFIYGPPGSGKSTIGKELADSLEMQFFDVDSLVEEKAFKKIYQIFEEDGETTFRQYENAIINSLIIKSQAVISLGGGSLLNQTLRMEVENAGLIITLIGEPETLSSRLEKDQNVRPLLGENLRSNLFELVNSRQVHYESFQFKFIVDNKSVEEVVSEIQAFIGRFHLAGMNQGYDIYVNPGCLSNIGNVLDARNFEETIVVVSDENVASFYLDEVLNSLNEYGFNTHPYVLPAGEIHKSLESVKNLWEEFARIKLERNHTVIALGGGVVGDLVGFASATYLRGVRWVNLPTTILSMVDASIGGKTGADLPQGKNLIGSFFPPALILVDTETLNTLPPEEARSGLSEVVKHGVIQDPLLYGYCKIGWNFIWENLSTVLSRAIRVKVNVVKLDPYEKNIRAILNFGHTLGHAIEKASNYSVRHGEAVAIGMVAASRVAEEYRIATEGIASDLTETLISLGLPVKLPGDIFDLDILNSMYYDKKRSRGYLTVVLPEEIGKVRYGFRLENPQQLIDSVR